MLASLYCQLGMTQKLPAGTGFISIDCGALVNRSSANINWVSDGTYVATGRNFSFANSTNANPPYDSLRSFSGNQSKNCYTLPSIANRRYLVRAGFLYGNYDRKAGSGLPSFELLFDASHWSTVTISDSNTTITHEMIVAVTRNQFSVCLARTNTSSSDPFISSLEIRPLSADLNMYSVVHENLLLKLNSRINFGHNNNNSVRYPDDLYDRIWDSDLAVINNISQYNIVSTNSTVSTSSSFNKPPSIVMQTARTASKSSNMMYSFNTNLGSGQYYSVLYFAEIQNTTAQRIFEVDVGDSRLLPNLNLASRYGQFTTVDVNISTSERSQSYTLALRPSANSTLGPILNAAESYLQEVSELPTHEQDVNALADIKQHFNLVEWEGDPCLPVSYKWSGVNCSTSTPPRVTALSLAKMQLNATIPLSIGNLSDLTVLNLSNNVLYGDIPPFLVNLSKLQELDLQNNNLSGTLPSGFRTNLTFRYSGNQLLCVPFANNTCGEGPGPASERNGGASGLKIGLISMAIIIFVTFTLGLIIYKLKRRRRKNLFLASSRQWPPVPPFTEISRSADPDVDLNEDKDDMHNYSSSEMAVITNNFEKKLGGGSFGELFHGMLPGGQEVVVRKLESKFQQTPTVFLKKICFLMDVHHRNILRLRGFCAEYKQQMLIYEFMSKGSLHDHLHDHEPLDWRTRLNILQQVAQGLENLHFTSSPSIIHGNLKSTNVLLSDTMLAKVSDVGLSELSPDARLVVDATSGYFDPEYFRVDRLTEKSDVYSFGVLMLEVVSGRSPIDTSLAKERLSIVDWARKTVQDGNCELVADSSLQGNYNGDALSKVVRIALQTLAANQNERPTMTEVVMELKDANKIELGHRVAFAEVPTVESWGSDEFSFPLPSQNGSSRNVDFR